MGNLDPNGSQAVFDAFDQWVERNISVHDDPLLFRCQLHLQALRLNMPEPGSVLIANAAADFAKLERMVRS
jgi:hypothetical protein